MQRGWVFEPVETLENCIYFLILFAFGFFVVHSVIWLKKKGASYTWIGFPFYGIVIGQNLKKGSEKEKCWKEAFLGRFVVE